MATASLRDLMPELRERFGVSGLWVFGSYARGDQSASSDLDVLVEFDRRGISLFEFVGLEQELGDRLGLRVDLVERDAIRPELRTSILNEATAVSGAVSPLAGRLLPTFDCRNCCVLGPASCYHNTRAMKV